MMRVSSLLTALLLAALAAGCATTGPPPEADEGAETPAPAAPDAAGGAAVVRPGLVLWVRVEVQGKWEIDEKTVRVSDQGEIRLPLVGTVQAVGLTLDDMGQLLAQLYRNYFVDPRISVDFSADDRQGLKPWGAVTVLGRVKQPGVIALPPTRRLSVVAAIQAAGGFDTSADQANIRITSPDAGVRRVNLRHMGRRGAPEEVDLVDGDIVFVPESIF